MVWGKIEKHMRLIMSLFPSMSADGKPLGPTAIQIGEHQAYDQAARYHIQPTGTFTLTLVSAEVSLSNRNNIELCPQRYKITLQRHVTDEADEAQ